MRKINKILVDLDPTKDRQPALERAIYLAKRFDASLCLFAAVYNRGLVSNLFLDSTQLESAKAGFVNSQKGWLSDYLKLAESQRDKVESEIRWHKPVYEAINQKAEAEGFDLIVKSTHPHPTLNKIFFTPNDWQLLKTSKIPVILVKENAPDSYQNIMAAIDPSNRHEHSQSLDPRILEATEFMASSLGAEAHALHCYDPIGYQLWNDIGLGMGVGMGPADFTLGEENYQAYVDQLKADNEKLFRQSLAKTNIKEANYHLVEGYPEQRIAEVASELSVDLMVMGTTYHSGLIGSTTEKVLDDLPCDLLAIPLDDN